MLRNPTQCYEKGPWKTFSSQIGDVMAVFQKNKLDPTGKDSKETNTGSFYILIQSSIFF